MVMPLCTSEDHILQVETCLPWVMTFLVLRYSCLTTLKAKLKLAPQIVTSLCISQSFISQGRNLIC